MPILQVLSVLTYSYTLRSLALKLTYSNSTTFAIALKWCEAITRGSFEKIDEMKSEILKHFSEREIVDITSCISIMNALNRIAISLRTL